METKKNRKHSRLFYRNTLLVWGSFLFTFGAAMASPYHWTTLVWLAALILLNYILWGTYLSIHPQRRIITRLTPKEFQMDYEAITFPSRDGLSLTAWYVPARNRAAIILVHGSGGGKFTMLKHAQFLAMEGYGILMPDLRAHGGSQGDTITGKLEANDVLGAVDYLRSRPEVDGAKIGALGISLGAWTVLNAAAQSPDLQAVILESMGPACLEDHGGRPTTLQRWINYPINWFSYALGDWMSGTKIEKGVMASLKKVAPRPVLLISAGRGKEIYFNRLFYEAAREPKALWEVPRADHATAYIYEPEAYREKVRGFFLKNLRGSL